MKSAKWKPIVLVAGLAAACVLCCSCATVDDAAAALRGEASSERLSIGEELNVPSPDGLGQRHPAVAYGDGVYLLAWREGFCGFEGNSRILAMRIDAAGRPLDSEPISISVASGEEDDPAVAFCGGRFLVAWTSRAESAGGGEPYRLNLRRVNAQGRCEGEVESLTGRAPMIRPALASNGNDEFMLVWQEYQDDYFAVLGTRLAAATGRRLNEPALKLMTRDAGRDVDWAMAGPLGVAWTGNGYVVAQSVYAVCLDPQGKVLLPRTQTWEAELPGGQSVVAAWGKGFIFHCARPGGDPWGWYGNGAIVGMEVTPDGAGQEERALRRMAGSGGQTRQFDLLADGQVANCIDAARWLNHPGWPMGIPGGLIHTVDDVWPSGSPAAAFNGESLMVVWPRAHRVDNRRLANRDLFLMRLLPGWTRVDEFPIPVATSASEETGPILCAGARGQALLAYEKLTDKGVAIRYRVLAESPDRRAPWVAYVAPLSREELIVAFDEPVAPAGGSTDGLKFKVDGLDVKRVEFNPDARAKGRQVILTTDRPEIGRQYTLHVDGVTDCSPAANAARRETFTFTALPGTVQHCPRIYQWDNPNSSELNYENPDRSDSRDYICNWLLLGPVPGGREGPPFDPATAMPSPGETVRTDSATFTWTRHEGEALNLGARMGKKRDHSAFAATYVYSQEPRDVLLCLDSNDNNRAWLNGRIVHDGIGSGAKARVFHDYTDVVPVRLSRGWNRLLVQAHNEGGWWMMVARIVDSRHRPIPTLTWQLDRPAESE